MAEERLLVRKSVPVLVAAILTWILVGLAFAQQGAAATAAELARHTIPEFAELMLFLILATAEPDWRAAMRKRAISAREVLRRHPWAIGLMESRMRPSPTNLRHRDAVLGILRCEGPSSSLATHAYNLLDSSIYGSALQEGSLPFSSPAELAEVRATTLTGIRADQYPNLHRVASELIASGFNYVDEFAFGLDLILDGLERMSSDPSG